MIYSEKLAKIIEEATTAEAKENIDKESFRFKCMLRNFGEPVRFSHNGNEIQRTGLFDGERILFEPNSKLPEVGDAINIPEAKGYHDAIKTPIKRIVEETYCTTAFIV